MAKKSDKDADDKKGGKRDNDADDIKIKPSREGKLHKALGVPAGNKIPLKRLDAAEHAGNPVLAKEARFAVNERSWKHPKNKNGRR